VPVERICLTCKRPFLIKPAESRRPDRGKYCSKACYWTGLKMTLDERLDLHTDKTSSPRGCWLWMGPLNKFGYAHIQINGKTRRLARVVLERTLGTPIPDGLNALHSCDTPACINPAHLSAGTPEENTRQCIERGRKPRGESHPMVRLTLAHAVEIRSAYLALPGTTSGNVERRGMVKRIADKYGVSVFTVREIGQRKTWRHVA
jgi:hypothetical protein